MGRKDKIRSLIAPIPLLIYLTSIDCLALLDIHDDILPALIMATVY
jgi:hypothetical protein